MRIVIAGLSLVAALALLVAPAGAESSSHRAMAILAEVKIASGGAAWDKVSGWHETGVHGSAAYETMLDYQHYGSLFKQTRDGQTSLRGFNGIIAWDQGPDGKVVVSTEPARLADARTTAYGSINGFLFPDRFPARFDYLRAATEGKRHYDILRITPEGANPFELWVDRATHLIGKLVDRTGKRPVTASITGYEEIDGLKLGSGFTVSDGIPAHTETVHIGSYEVVPVSRTIFDPPAETSPAVSEAANAGDEFSIPHQRVDIGGRKLNLYCAGEGAPVVVFDSPLGAAGWNWFKVLPVVAQHSRACVYDRAGFGFSDASRRPGNSANAANDLHALLKAAAIPGPYLLVGSSYGAMNVQLYAYRYPAEIAGLVLVDGQNEDEFQLLDVITNGIFAKARPGTLAHDRECAKSAAAATVPDQCRWEEDRGAGARLAAAVEQERGSPAYWRANESEYADCCGGASSLQLHKARRNFGDFPVMILARSVSPYGVPDQPPSPRNRAGEDVHAASLEAVLAYAPKGELRVVPNASHLIQIEQPKAVSDAIIEVLGRVGEAGREQHR